MSDKYKNKYRIQSTRLQNWDYGQNGYYFVTICTKNREHFFGEINNGKMQLSPIGKLAEKYWNEIPQHFPFVILDAFVVMPNHVHGIITIAKNGDGVDIVGNDDGDDGDDVDDGGGVGGGGCCRRDAKFCVSTGHPTPTPTQTPPTQTPPTQTPPTQTPPTQIPPIPPIFPSTKPSPKNKFGPQSKNLASIIRGYKIGVTKNAKQIDPLWKWQPRFHDHIIRNNQSLQRIRKYIINNPLNWKEDTFHK